MILLCQHLNIKTEKMAFTEAFNNQSFDEQHCVIMGSSYGSRSGGLTRPCESYEQSSS
jgi:hypothetical protein